MVKKVKSLNREMELPTQLQRIVFLTCNGVQRRGRAFEDVGLVFRVDCEWTPVDKVDVMDASGQP